jgi:release factor glutamine methyltransferase
VEWVLEVAAASWQVVDVGTGSGCIALALARELQGATVTGVDVSDGALAVARSNAQVLGIDCGFLLLDILQANGEEFRGLDAVVSNPPYIPETEWKALEPHVREHEPALALRVPDGEPLLYYNKVSEASRRWLKPGGWLFFEVHEGFGEDVARLMERLGYGRVEVRRDMGGRVRMVAGQFTPADEKSGAPL